MLTNNLPGPIHIRNNCWDFNATHGGGRHLYYLKPGEIEYATKVTWIENPLGIMCLGVAKISVAFLMLRLIGPAIVWRKWCLYLSIILTFIIGSLASILTFVQCNPPRALRKAPSQVPGAKRWNPKVQSDFATFCGGQFETRCLGKEGLLTSHSLLCVHRYLSCPPSHHVRLEVEPEYPKKGCVKCIVELGCFVYDCIET